LQVVCNGPNAGSGPLVPFSKPSIEDAGALFAKKQSPGAFLRRGFEDDHLRLKTIS
jgi:hypothetical protein